MRPVRSLRVVGATLPGDLHFRTQAAGVNQAIPDLVGEDPQRRQRLIIEAKFWAGLTDAQPCAYLRRIEAQGDGTLAFVVPESRRADTVWQELVRRCAADGIPLAEAPTVAGARYTAVGFGGGLALVSWRALLANLLSELESAGEVLVASDLRQLQSLCAREEADAFLPLTSDELTGDAPRRVQQFSEPHLVEPLGVAVAPGRRRRGCVTHRGGRAERARLLRRQKEPDGELPGDLRVRSGELLTGELERDLAPADLLRVADWPYARGIPQRSR